jgi:hypothetical protein
MRRVLISLAAAGPIGIAACAVDRDPACIAADACDQALAEPFGDFALDDPAFGDGGTCWQSTDTARPCVAACDQFRVDQRRSALDQAEAALGTNKEVPLAVFVACGGEQPSDAAQDTTE